MIVHHAWVVLLREDGTKAIIRASRNAEVRSGHMRALADQLVGHPYGSTFEFREADDSAIPHGPFKSLDHLNAKRAKKQKQPLKYLRLHRVKASEDAFAILQSGDAEAGEGEEEAGEKETPPAASSSSSAFIDEKDNRDYVADPNNQKADSIGMRKAGASGHEIVRALTENSITFNKKTKFSQEKFLRKITQKHVPRVTVVRATSRTVAEVLFTKHPASMTSDTMRALRWIDSLPQMLAYGNIHAGVKCLVLDGTSGLLSLAILERLNEDQGGRLYFVGTTPKEVKFGGGRPFIDLLNIPKQSLASRFVVCSSARLDNGKIRKEALDDEEEVFDPAPKAEEIIKELAESEDEEDEEQEKDSATAVKQDEKRLRPTLKTDEEMSMIKEAKASRKEEMFRVLDMETGQGADSLLIAARQDPWEALQVLLPHLGLGRPFVVHHPCIEPLMIARAKLAESKSFLDLAVTESFCREYQVLPNRTHPTMTGSATGGFLLRGIKVQSWKE